MKIKIINSLSEALSAVTKLRSDFFFCPENLVKEEQVRQIVLAVKEGKDQAVRLYTQKFDGVDLPSIVVDSAEMKKAYDALAKTDREALDIASMRIKKYHQKQLASIQKGFSEMASEQVISAVSKAAVYVPGGRASYYSTVLMTAIPAKVAGVEEVVLLTPPNAEGTVPPNILAAAHAAGVDTICTLGGVPAIAAAAFGTESVPKVDVICGPGNIYVTLAKKIVYGAVNIDALQGPSEALIIADDTSDPVLAASEIIAQAEHDPLSQSVLVTVGPTILSKILDQIQKQAQGAPRQAIIQKSLESNSLLVTVENMAQAIELTNAYAPEHLCIMTENAPDYLHDLRHAGCVFIGINSGVEFGDYVAGPSHALPTGGTARFYSPLNVLSFLKIMDVVQLDDDTLAYLAPTVINMAKNEGFYAHAAAAEMRWRKLGRK